MSLDESAIVYRAAAGVLRRDGWRQHANHDRDDRTGRHCLVGGLEVACRERYGGRGPAGRAFFDAVDQLAEDADIGPTDGWAGLLGRYNDTAGRTAGEVIELLETTAEAVAGATPST
jgi:hypothetical protein